VITLEQWQRDVNTTMARLQRRQETVDELLLRTTEITSFVSTYTGYLWAYSGDDMAPSIETWQQFPELALNFSTRAGHVLITMTGHLYALYALVGLHFQIESVSGEVFIPHDERQGLVLDVRSHRISTNYRSAEEFLITQTLAPGDYVLTGYGHIIPVSGFESSVWVHLFDVGAAVKDLR